MYIQTSRKPFIYLNICKYYNLNYNLYENADKTI